MDTDPKGPAGAAKPQLQLMPPAAIEACCGALSCGAVKYQPWNWRSVQVTDQTYIAAMMRHIMAYQRGEDADPESGASHLGHVMAGCAIILDAMEAGTLVDDRPRRNESHICDMHRAMDGVCFICGDIDKNWDKQYGN